MNVRKIVKEEVRKTILNEFKIPFSNGAFKSIPDNFDHLKWEFNANQKFYLQDLCEVNPSSLTESDYKEASKMLGISKINVQSIVNTYSTYSPMREASYADSKESMNSALTFGNKPATAIDLGLSVNDNKLPVRTETRINNNPPSMSKLEAGRKAEADFKDRTWYREGEGKEHPSKATGRFYEGLEKSLMMYLFCEANPKDINLREDSKIQLDFDSVMEENRINKLDGGPNFENEKHKFINNLLKEFNDKFGCSYVIYDHIKTDGGIRMFIEHNVTSQVDMSKDSMAMMKNFLLTKVITGHKIEQENSHIASLMGLDAGDTSWLEGPIGQAPQSGILTRNR